MNMERPVTILPGKYLNVLYLRDEPGVTVKDRQRPLRHWEQPERHRDGTVATPGPIQTPAEQRHCPGCRRWCPVGAPVNAGRVPA
ncbi:hypothetical protein DPMN_082649 [Dreissena polymorpha]|uniref:Uncharacterized protein n=1 Tax=Dreissena polymorpha TaxID=45954 RepID=A0A9D3Y7C7_DREPO|nr:hypothetical protein DPMN_082649 [Dreissena polymorpha]